MSKFSSGICMSVEKIINSFGGVRPLASALGLPASTVQNWKRRGRIPQWHFGDLIGLGAQSGILIDLEKLTGCKTSKRSRK